MYAEAVAPPAAQLLEVLVAVIPMATGFDEAWHASFLAFFRYHVDALASKFGFDQNLDFCCVFHSRAACAKIEKPICLVF